MAKGNRRFILTINSDEIVARDDSKEYVLSLLKEKYKDLVYVVVGREHAPTTGKEHLHVYVEFVNQKSEVQLRRLLANAHSDVYTNYDNGAQAYQYITKEDTEPLEYGKCKFDISVKGNTSRQANGYQGAVEMIFQGEDLGVIIRTYPEIALRHYNALKSLWRDFQYEYSRETPSSQLENDEESE